MSSFNGAGVFSISGAGQPYVSGTTISSSVANQLGTDIANGLSTCLLKDGTQTATAVIPFALGLSSAALVDLSAGTAGQIKFPATQNASANANTLDDYEEGSWTPADASGAGLSLTIARATRVKIGSIVFYDMAFSYPVTANGANAVINGFPFTTANVSGAGGFFPLYVGGAAFLAAIPVINSDGFLIVNSAGVAVLNSALSGASLRAQFMQFTI